MAFYELFMAFRKAIGCQSNKEIGDVYMKDKSFDDLFELMRKTISPDRVDALAQIAIHFAYFSIEDRVTLVQSFFQNILEECPCERREAVAVGIVKRVLKAIKAKEASKRGGDN